MYNVHMYARSCGVTSPIREKVPGKLRRSQVRGLKERNFMTVNMAGKNGVI